MPAFANHINRLYACRLFAAPRALAALAALVLAVCGLSISPTYAQSRVTATAAAPVRYRVVNLGAGSLTRLPVINASGQVAFSLFDGALPLAYVFDGKRVVPLGTLGGSAAYTSGINDSGQVSGFAARDNGADPHFGAFRWSAASGMIDLGTLDGGSSQGMGINNRGEVVGDSGGMLSAPRAFRWNSASGMEEIGTLAGNGSAAVGLNDAGLVTGYSNAASMDTHTFVWTRGRGIEDIGTLGGAVSYPQAVGARGEVSGYSDTAAGLYHAFLWTRAGGMRDLGTLNGSESFVLAMSPQAHIAGVVNVDSGYQRAVSWTAATGMIDLGTFGGPGARAASVNNRGQVVGWALASNLALRAFVWTRAQGLTDLNSRLVDAPAGLVLESAEAVSDNGAIVASSNAGLVLLRPVGQDVLPAPVVGPVQAPALVRAGAPATLSVAFTDAQPKELHRVSLDWGDAAMETALVTERNGAGSASAGHIYRDPGVYGIIARVTDSAGNTTTVRREVVVDAAGVRAAGSGCVLAPRGADRHAPAQAGPAAFSFVAPGKQAAGGKLSFTTTRLAFTSASMSAPLAVQGGQRISGSGKLNGKAGYFYTLTVAAGAAGTAASTNDAGTFALRIWHSDPVSRAEVVDFDNGITGVATRGTTLAEGAIAAAP